MVLTAEAGTTVMLVAVTFPAAATALRLLVAVSSPPGVACSAGGAKMCQAFVCRPLTVCVHAMGH